VRLEGLGQLKTPVISSGIRTRDLPACSIIPRRPLELNLGEGHFWDDTEQNGPGRYRQTTRTEERYGKKLRRKDCEKLKNGNGIRRSEGLRRMWKEEVLA
jgi:hypothetical protein